ncbi:MAG: protein kinase [Bacteroidota bacterium]
MDIQPIIKHIAENNIEEALRHISDYFEEINRLEDDLITLQSRYNQVKKDQQQNLIDYDQYNIQISRITKAILDFVAELETTASVKVNEEQESTTNVPIPFRKQLQASLYDKDYIIVNEIDTGMTNTFFKVRKSNSPVKDRFYVAQIFKQDSAKFDQKLLDFFYDARSPFVSIQDFSAEYPRYIIRDYIDGINIHKLLKAGVKLSLPQILKSTISIAKGLRALHQNRIFHDDLAPSNILLDAKSNTHILPMNIFLYDKSSITWRQLEDTIKYASPEQLNQLGKAAKRRPKFSANQYSLGLILFLMMTRDSLFDGSELMGIYRDRFDVSGTMMQLEDFQISVYLRLSFYELSEERNRELGDRLIQVLAKLLSAVEKERYQNMDELIEEVQSLSLKIEEEREQQEVDTLRIAHKSYENCIYDHKNFLDIFYNKLSEVLPAKESIQADENRNLRLHYAIEYLFKSIVKLENSLHILEASASIFQVQHSDFTLGEYDEFLRILLECVEEYDVDWNEDTKNAWNELADRIYEAMEEMFGGVSA